MLISTLLTLPWVLAQELPPPEPAPPDAAPAEAPAETGEGEPPAEAQEQEEQQGQAASAPAEAADVEEVPAAPAVSTPAPSAEPLPALDASSAEDAERPPFVRSVNGNEEFKFRFYRDDSTLEDFPDEDHLYDYIEIVERLNLLLQTRAGELGLQVDAVGLLADSYYVDNVRYYEHDLIGEGMTPLGPSLYAVPEKFWWSHQLGAVDVSLGDNYMSLGRGFALNLIKNTDIDIDTSIRGAQLTSDVGDWSFGAISGLTNPQQVQLTNPNRALRADTHSMVSAARIDRYGLGKFNLGTHGAAYSLARTQESFADGLAQYSAGLDALVGGAWVEAFGLLGMDWYLEGDYFQYFSEDLFAGEEFGPGHALYGSAVAYLGRITVLAEFKDALNTERVNALSGPDNFEFAVGPSLEYERVITEDSAATVNSNDVTGGRVRADIAAVPGVVTPYVSLSVFKDRDLDGLHFNRSQELITHPTTGVEWYGDRVQTLINAGYRVDDREDLPEEYDLDYGADRLIHADIDLRVRLGGLQLEGIVDLQDYRWGDNVFQQDDFTQTSYTLSMNRGGDSTLTLYSDYSDNPLLQSEGNISEYVYAAGEWIQHLEGSANLRLFYGAYRAGIRCAGGQCRNLPGFEGARVTYSQAF